MTENQEINSKAYLNDKLKLKKFKEKLRTEEITNRKLADKIKSIKPYKRPNKSNSLTEQKFKQQYQKEKENHEKSEFILKTNYVTTERNSCLINISSLKSINLKDMMVNKMQLRSSNKKFKKIKFV